MTTRPPNRRRALRLQGYDYSQAGAYFITIVTHERQHLLGEIASGEMKLNRFGEIVNVVWQELPRHYPHILLDAFVIMPNHVHAVIVISEVAGKGEAVRSNNYDGLPEIVRALKSFSARRINTLRQMNGNPVWQRSFYEHIIRNDNDLEQIRRYIDGNTLLWEQDQENK